MEVDVGAVDNGDRSGVALGLDAASTPGQSSNS